MFRRRLFFWFEKLQITPAERRSVALLLTLLVVLSAAAALMQPPTPYDAAYYRELDEQFAKLSAGPALPAATRHDTLTSDTLHLDTLASDTLRRTAGSRIDINTADAGELQSLPGIGPVYASRIIAYRENFGLFETVEELLNIKGIGEKRLEKIKPFIKLRE